MIAFALKQSSQAHNFNQSLSCWYTFVYYICYSTALISGMEVKGEAISAVWLVGISTTSLAEGCRRAVNNVANLAETTQHFVEDNRYPVQDAIENLNRYVQIIGFFVVVLLILLCVLVFILILRELEQHPLSGDLSVPCLMGAIFCLACLVTSSVHFLQRTRTQLHLHQQHDDERNEQQLHPQHDGDAIDDDDDEDNGDDNTSDSDNDDEDTRTNGISIWEFIINPWSTFRDNGGVHGLLVQVYNWLPGFLIDTWDIIVNQFLASIWDNFRDWIQQFSRFLMRNRFLGRFFRDGPVSWIRKAFNTMIYPGLDKTRT